MNLNRKHLGAIFLLTAFLNLFFFRRAGTLGLTLIFTGFFLYFLTVLPIRKYYRKYSAAFCLYFILTFSSLVLPVFRGNVFVQTGLLASSLVYFLFLIYLTKAEIPFFRSVSELLLAPLSVFLSHISTFFRMLSSLSLSGERSKKNGIMKKILVITASFILGIPVVFIFISLFSSADPIFAKSVKEIMDHLNLNRIMLRIFWSALIISVFVPVIKLTINHDFSLPFKADSFSALTTPLTVISLMVSLVTGFFLAVEWPYIFVNVAKETDLSIYGIATYSEYVKRGFGELLFAGLIFYGLGFLGTLPVKSKNKTTYFRLIMLSMIAEFMVFQATIARRIMLYWQFHGLTLVRVYGGMFLVLLFSLTVILALRYLFKYKWIYIESGTIAVFIIFMGLYNFDRYIIYNHPPTVNNRIDYLYLARLSPDGTEGWLKAYDYAQTLITSFKDRDPSSFTQDNRMDLAYSGMILNSLGNSYFNLIRIYGSKEEKVLYQKSLFSSLENQLNRYLELVRSTANTADSINIAARGMIINIVPGTGSYWNDSLENQIKTAKEKLEIISGNGMSLGNITLNRNFRNISYRPGETCQYIDSGNRLTIPFCMPGYFSITSEPETDISGFERILMYNLSYRNAWEELKARISPANLLKLQSEFTQIYYRIMALDENQRTYPRDTSTESLFLQSY